MPDNRLLFPLHLFNIWAKLPGSSNPSRFRLLPEVEHICVMGKITTAGGDEEPNLSARCLCRLRIDWEKKSDMGVLLGIVEIYFK
jgi:hypothetical protein